MKKSELMKKFGLSPENFDFYVEAGMIHKLTKSTYTFDPKLYDWIIEKGTVFKYSYDDSFQEDSREFVNVVKNTGKIKIFTKEEIEEYKKNQRGKK